MLSEIYFDHLVLALFMGLLLWVAFTDLRSFRIPNSAILAMAALYPLHVLVADQPVAWIYALVVAAVVLTVGIAMFVMGAMGGGDVKLLTVAVLWAGPEYFAPFLLVTVCAGLALAMAMAVRTAWLGDGTASGGGLAATLSGLRHVPIFKLIIPYGVAVAVGGIYSATRIVVA